MRIRSVTTTVIAVPDLPLRNVVGCHQPYALRTIIQLETDDGLVGLGEMPGGKRFQQELETAAAEVCGLDPFHLEQLRLRFADRPRILSAFEVPCLDIIGKATGRSVAEILGGPVRQRVPFSAYLFYKFATPDDWLETPVGQPKPTGPLGLFAWSDAVLTPEAMVAEAEQFVTRYGFRVLKLKGGVLSPELEVETLRLLRERFGPTVQLRIDPNGGWSVETAIRLAPVLEELGLEYYEDPVAGMDAMAEVAQQTRLPLATNMCVTAFAHLPEAIAKRAVQIVLADHHAWGGLRASVQLGWICDVFGLGLSQHSNTHLGISFAAMVHLAAALPQLTFASDTHYPWQEGWDIVNERFVFEDGAVTVPSGPGLGVTLNPDALAQLAAIAEAVPWEERDDRAIMRRWFPEWSPSYQPW